ncbi:unnamed protein product [Microthlaspi erraticum]|uniref:Uncharacterized protein n=1 Tax=Microthlaspi erraticum TaxID=1685480 RepID=A0A6D2IR37_9BRAS|nr:unnamed protein product [Microthlaspi erraticum]
MTCLLSLQSTPDLSRVLASLTRFRKHFPEGHPSFNYSSPSTLNSGVTYRPLTEKAPLGPWASPLSTAGPLFLRGSNDLFTIPAINTRPFPVFWPHSHGFGNHFPKRSPILQLLHPSTLNSGVTYRPLTEKVFSGDVEWSDRVEEIECNDGVAEVALESTAKVIELKEIALEPNLRDRVRVK